MMRRKQLPSCWEKPLPFANSTPFPAPRCRRWRTATYRYFEHRFVYADESKARYYFEKPYWERTQQEMKAGAFNAVAPCHWHFFYGRLFSPLILYPYFGTGRISQPRRQINRRSFKGRSLARASINDTRGE